MKTKLTERVVVVLLRVSRMVSRVGIGAALIADLTLPVRADVGVAPDFPAEAQSRNSSESRATGGEADVNGDSGDAGDEGGWEPIETSKQSASSWKPRWAAPIVLNYTNVFYGPSVKNPSSYLPSSDGTPDRSRAVYMRNFLSAGYGISDTWAVTATAYWWYRPVLGQELTMQDPFLRVSDSSVFSTDWGLNLYSDARVHLGTTQVSRAADMITGLQNFDYLTYQPGNGRFIFALRASARYNVYGPQGAGIDTEFYLAPEVNFRFGQHWALTGLYEMGSSHQHGDKPTYFTNDGTDFEPGIEWDPTPEIVVNPYLTLLTGGRIDWASTSVGMFFTWNFF